MTPAIGPTPRRASRLARRLTQRVLPQDSAIGSRTFAFTMAAALALTLGLTGCEATGQPTEGTAGQPTEEAAGQPPEGVQPEEREDDRELRRLPAFRALDTDDDGDISADEIDAAPASLASLDDDGDGRLSGDELRPGRGGPRVFIRQPGEPPREGTRMMTLGADEELDLADLPPQLRSLLAPADGDGDGTASGMEILAAMMAAQGGEPGDGEPEGPRGPMPLMATLDADQDGTVSETEIESAAQSLRTLDTDGDGRISPDELQPVSSGGSSDGDLPE